MARPGSRYRFFGFETDTALATCLFALIDRAIRTEIAAFRQVNSQLRAARLRRASASFQYGVAARIAERLGSMHEAREAAGRAQRSNGTALILVKHRVVEDAFRETDVRLVRLSAVGPQRITAAFREGLGRRGSGQPESPHVGRRAGLARLSGPRDRQRSRVDEWENPVEAPCDPTTLPFPNAQAMIKAIGADMGLRYPPSTEKLPRDATVTLASAPVGSP